MSIPTIIAAAILLLAAVVAIGTTNIQHASADRDFEQSSEKAQKKCTKAGSSLKKAEQGSDQFERHTGLSTICI
jgi:ABC-type molybdate transport system substrate-binding protein